MSPTTKKSPKRKRGKRENDVQSKEVPTSVPAAESEVSQRRDGPIVSDSPKESVQKVHTYICMYIILVHAYIHTCEL